MIDEQHFYTGWNGTVGIVWRMVPALGLRCEIGREFSNISSASDEVNV